MHNTRKVLEDLIWVGADDRRLSCFEGVYSVPEGVSYNSYLLLDRYTVLFDTVDRAVSGQFFENLAYALNGRKLDFLVIHHMEPDHAATVSELILRHPEVKIICGGKAAVMLEQFFDDDFTGRVIPVNEGDVFTFGRHEFTFVNAPMVHWPEVIFSYDRTDRILFSADAFGTFGALNGHLFADEVDFFRDYLDEARRYYTNIVGKYGPQVQSVLKKAGGLAIDFVCPLHGFVWRKGFGDYLEKYAKWSAYEPEVKGAVIAYASVYGHTENAANILAGKLAERGVPVEMFDTSVIPCSNILSACFKYSHLVFASTTYNAGVFVNMENLLHDVVNHALKNRRVALLENGTWAPTSGKLMAGMLEKLKDVTLIDAPVTIKSAPKQETLARLEALANKIAEETVVKKTAPVPVLNNVLEVSNEAFFNFTYGVEILTTLTDGRDYGCVINTAYQVAAGDVKKVAVSVINQNHTCDMIRKSGLFNVSVLTQDVPFAELERFGFHSGRDTDKFEGLDYEERSASGVRYVSKYANALFSCRVIHSVDLGASTLFVGEVLEAKKLSGDPSCTYGYYHAHIKPKKQAPAEQKEGWRCRVCGYFYEGHELPADFVCPLCKHGPEDFEYVPAVTVKKKKGFICKVCGYFEEFDGEKLPDDYVCPICHHGVEEMEPAEQ